LQEKYYNGPSTLDIAVYNQDYYVEKIKNHCLLNFLVYFIFSIYLTLLMFANLLVKLEKKIFSVTDDTKKAPLSIKNEF